MTELHIDGLTVPTNIKRGLEDLSQNFLLNKEGKKGSNGYVFFGKNRVMGTPIAIKIYYWGSEKRYHAEPQHLAQIKSPNLLSIFDAGYIDHEWAYFVTPFCSNGDLDDIISTTKLGNLEVIDLASQVLSGLSFLHGERLVHRDLKPANIYLDENRRAIIGDFGSIKKVPEGKVSIPASSHAVLYRPPESFDTNSYSFSGDVYQAGVVLYQLLGGHLPYEGTSWLSRQQLSQYILLSSPADQSIFVDECIHKRIKKGKLLDLESLPPWVPATLLRIIRKACNSDPKKRFASAADFMVKLNQTRPLLLNWSVVDGCPTLRGGTSFRVLEKDNRFRVQKRRNRGAWRNDNSITRDTLREVVLAINAKVA